MDGEEVLDIEEEEYEQEQGISNNNLITHHNTHQESEQICWEYSTQLQDLEVTQYYDE